jgi:hypothetical protein
MSMDDAYAILNYELESCFICGALVRRGNGSIQHEAWHRRLEGDDVAPP